MHSSFRRTYRPLIPLVLATMATHAFAQGPTFQTPGMPGAGTPGTPGQMGQTTRFSTEFNPALGFVIDSVFDYTDFDDSAESDGFDLSLRLFEFNGAAFIDPSAWAWVAIVAEEGEIELEEAAVQYIGLPGNMGLRGGRFFVDFGKQMQAHLEELRTIERPAVLRTYLGQELAGDGLQFDNWHAVGDETVLRYSLGVFADLVTQHADEDGPPMPAAGVDEHKVLGDLNFTGRLTAFRDAGENGVFQAGSSVQYVPSFSFSDPDGVAPDVEDLDRVVYGIDLTYGLTDEEGNRQLTLGGEFLVADGAIGAGFGGGPTIDVLEDDTSGFYTFADYSWTPRDSGGVQYSQVELPETGTPDFAELDIYYTRALSEFQRLRFQVTHGDVEGSEEYVRFAVQWTAFFGNHSHGFNW